MEDADVRTLLRKVIKNKQLGASKLFIPDKLKKVWTRDQLNEKGSAVAGLDIEVYRDIDIVPLPPETRVVGHYKNLPKKYDHATS